MTVTPDAIRATAATEENPESQPTHPRMQPALLQQMFIVHGRRELSEEQH